MKNVVSYISTPLVKVRDRAIDFVKNSQAVAAVEFALIAPLLLVLFVGTVEVSLLVSIDRKLSRTSSTIADLIAQGENFSSATGKQDLRAILGVTEYIMFPYSDKIPCVVITTVRAAAEDTNGNGVIDGGDDVVAKVVKSIDNSEPSPEYNSPPAAQCNRVGTDNARKKRTTDEIFVLPDAINTDGTELVVAEVEYDHTPIVGLINTHGVANVTFDRTALTLGDRIFLRPRRGMPDLPN